jgi:nicotinamide-nucleotide amidase
MPESNAQQNKQLPYTVGILATGTEIINGDIPNSNGRVIAQHLRAHSMQPGQQLTVDDALNTTRDGLTYLGQHHRAIITIGGLGPTEDDLTRHALAAYLQRPMLHDDATWQAIQTRLKQHNYPVHPSNQRQAYFPEGAHIIPNPRGTAHAAYFLKGEQIIIMLPGPPSECLPLFKAHILPLLAQHGFEQPRCFKRWMLMGLAESEASERIEACRLDSNKLSIGYRVESPYLEVKCESQDAKAFDEAVKRIDACLKDVALSDAKTAPELLQDYLKKNKLKLAIDDQATGGQVASRMLQPSTQANWCFDVRDPAFKQAALQCTLTGLDAYWKKNQAPKAVHAQLHLHITHQDQLTAYTHRIPNRPGYTARVSVDWMAAYLLAYLKKSSTAG